MRAVAPVRNGLTRRQSQGPQPQSRPINQTSVLPLRLSRKPTPPPGVTTYPALPEYPENTGKYRLTAGRKAASYPAVMTGRNNELLLSEALRLRSAAVGL